VLQVIYTLLARRIASLDRAASQMPVIVTDHKRAITCGFLEIEIRHHLVEIPSPSSIRGTNQAAIAARKKDGKTRPRIRR